MMLYVIHLEYSERRFYKASTAILPVEHGLSADKEGNAHGY